MRPPSAVPSAVVRVHVMVVWVIESGIPCAIVPRIVETPIPSAVPAVVVPGIVTVTPAVSSVVPRVVIAPVEPWTGIIVVVVPGGIPVVCIVVLIEVGDCDACAGFFVESDGGRHVVRDNDAVFLVSEQIYRRFFCLLHEFLCLFFLDSGLAAVSE